MKKSYSKLSSLRIQMIVFGLIIVIVLPGVIGWFLLSSFKSFASSSAWDFVLSAQRTLKNDIEEWFKSAGEIPLINTADALSELPIARPLEAKQLLMNLASQYEVTELTEWTNVISSKEYLDKAKDLVERVCDEGAVTDERCQLLRGYLDIYSYLHPAWRAVSGDVLWLYAGYEDGAMMDGSFWVPEKGAYDPRVRPWYKKAMKNPGKVIYTDPYIDANTGEIIVTLAKTFEVNGEIAGVVGIDFELVKLVKMVHGSVVKDGDKLVAFPIIYANNSIIVAHPNIDTVGLALDPEKYGLFEGSDGEKYKKIYEGKLQKTGLKPDLMKERWQHISSAKDGDVIEGADRNGNFVMRIVHLDNGWILGYKMYDAYFASYISARNKSIITIVVLAVVFSLLIFWFVNRILGKLNAIASAAMKVAEGDLTVDIPDYPFKTEIGYLVSALKTLALSLKDFVVKVTKTTASLEDASRELSVEKEPFLEI